MNPTGWKKEPLRFADYDHERIYGSVPYVDIQPLVRDVSGIPIIFQGSLFTCVASTITWIKQYFEKLRGNPVPLSQDFLAVASSTEADGATPSQVLMTAKDIGICESKEWVKNNQKISEELKTLAEKHKIVGFAYLKSLAPQAIYSAIIREPIMVGVDSYEGSEPHMMAGVGIEKRNDVWGVKTINWWKAEVQDEGWVPFGDVRFAASILKEKPAGNVAINPLYVLLSKWSFVSTAKRVIGAIGAALLVLFGGLSQTPKEPIQTPVIAPEGFRTPSPKASTDLLETVYGASGIYDIYSAAISGAGITATDTYIPVTTLEVGETGVTIVSASTTFPVYVVVNPSSRSTRETFECNALDTVLKRFTSCYRQIAPTCNNATSTIQSITGTTGAFPHAAGETVILSNSACFFNRFVDKTTRQMDIAGQKGFSNTSTYIGADSTSTNQQLNFLVGAGNSTYLAFQGPVAGYTTATALLNLGAGEFVLNASGTTVGVSPTGGLVLNAGLLSISPSTTGAVTTDTNGLILVNVSSTASTNGGFLKRLGNRIYWDVVDFLSSTWTWTGAQTFNTATTTFQKIPVDGNGGTIGMPIGSLTPYASSTAPIGWLLADGAAISRTTYSALFAVVGTTYGVGDGATTFNLPNLKGRIPVMASSSEPGYTTYGFQGGSSTHIMTEAELVAHTHQQQKWTTGSQASNPPSALVTDFWQTAGASTLPATQSTGNSAAFDIRDPYLVMSYIIKF